MDVLIIVFSASVVILCLIISMVAEKYFQWALVTRFDKINAKLQEHSENSDKTSQSEIDHEMELLLFEDKSRYAKNLAKHLCLLDSDAHTADPLAPNHILKKASEIRYKQSTELTNSDRKRNPSHPDLAS